MKHTLVVRRTLALLVVLSTLVLVPWLGLESQRGTWVPRVSAQPPTGNGPGPGIAPVRPPTPTVTQGRPTPAPHNPRSFLPANSDGIFVLEVARLRGHPAGPQLDNAIANFPDWRALTTRGGLTPAATLDRLIITQAADGTYRRTFFGTHRSAPAPRIWDVAAPSASRGQGTSMTSMGRTSMATSMGATSMGMRPRAARAARSPKPPAAGVSMGPPSLAPSPTVGVNWRPLRANLTRSGTWTLPRAHGVRDVFLAGDDFSVAHAGQSTTTWRELLRVSQTRDIRTAITLPAGDIALFEAIGLSQITPGLPWRGIARVRPNGNRWEMAVELIYDTSARADIGMPFLEARRQRAAGLAMVHLLGLAPVLRNMQFTKTDNIIRTTIALDTNQLHVLLSFGGRRFR